jgi:hypothetical protein
MRAGLVPALLADPTATGTPTAGQTLTASTGNWTNIPTAFAYQWQRCDTGGSSA